MLPVFEAKPKNQKLNPSLDEEYMTPCQRGYNGGNDPPSNLIPLLSIDKGSSITVHEVWVVWNSTLRSLDDWHKGLIAETEGSNIHALWARKWYRTYRYYREIGEDVERNLGKSVPEVTDRMDSYRLAFQINSIQGLFDIMRVARGKELFGEERKAVDPSHRGAHGFYNGKDPPRNLISLPIIGRRYTVNEAWEVCYSTLRKLDYWHKGLIEERECKEDSSRLWASIKVSGSQNIDATERSEKRSI